MCLLIPHDLSNMIQWGGQMEDAIVQKLFCFVNSTVWRMHLIFKNLTNIKISSKLCDRFSRYNIKVIESPTTFTSIYNYARSDWCLKLIHNNEFKTAAMMDCLDFK